MNVSVEDPVLKLAQEKFGIKYLYPWQRLVIANILEANDYCKMMMNLSENEKSKFEEENSDSFCLGRQIVLLPTGAGKSLCFQIPAIILNGPTLVVYPLLALMSDQQRRLEECNIDCVVLKGGQSKNEREDLFCRVREGTKVILANPEVLENDNLLSSLKTLGISHVAIDEAHCVYEWGKSFRHSYLSLNKVLSVLQVPLVTAFTATASPEVLENISRILFDGEVHVVRSESDRANIHYYVRYSSAKTKDVLFLAKNEQKPMIVFCGTRKKTENMARDLNLCFGEGTSFFYHAGLQKSEKKTVEEWFYNSKDGILCATCAYGMGVDKKDIKTVVHLEPAQTVEAYIQEAGRAGRDGSIAKAFLLWSLEDSKKFSVFGMDSRERMVKEFAESDRCRRQILLDALGAERVACSGCDVCDNVKNQSDWEFTYSIINKNRNFYNEMEIEERIFSDMNIRYRKSIGKNIWTHADSVEVIRQLKESGKIKEAGWLWKGRLRAVSSNP